MSGLTFDAGFAADHYFTLTGGDSGGGVGFFLSYADLSQVDGDGEFLGATGAGNSTFPVTLTDVKIGIDNSNTAGVTAVDAAVPSAADAPNVTTGIELEIPLSRIGNPGGPVRICAFINDSSHTMLSNQVLGSLPADSANLGEPGAVNFGSIPGQQFFTAAVSAVTHTADSGPGSLRQTLANAPAGSTITFDPSLSGQTITLDGSELLLDKNLTIDASALPAGLTIDADAASRVMRVVSGITVTLDSLTLANGEADEGGGIHNSGTLTLIRCTLSGNFASSDGGGISTSGTLTIHQSTLTGNSADNFGGGFYHFGNLTINQSTLAGNSAVNGGGGFSGATLTVNQSTLTGNSASSGGAGIYIIGSLTLSRSTLTGNSAVGGAGGFFHVGTQSVTGSIVAGNTGAGSNANYSSSTNIATGTNLFSGDPLLAPLGDYGGPTQTMPPLPGSPAIDPAGGQPTSPFATDQRGMPRVVDGNADGSAIADIGAVEFLQGTNLDGIDFTGLDLAGIDLSGSSLLGTNFSANDLSATILDGARYNLATQFQPGFDLSGTGLLALLTHAEVVTLDAASAATGEANVIGNPTA